MIRIRLLLSVAFLCVCFVQCQTTLQAQTVKWRQGYAAARKEAVSKGLPIVLYFRSDTCPWCDKMREETFNNPSVSKLLNSEFIPLKVYSTMEPQLVNALRVTAFPTVYFADSDGKILGNVTGYQKASQFHETVMRALAQVTNPPWMLADYKKASDAWSLADYPKAITLLKNIVDDGKTRPIQRKAQDLLNKIETQAETLLADAKQLSDSGQAVAAAEKLSKIVRNYPGTRAADGAGGLLSRTAVKDPVVKVTNQQQARILLAEARQFYEKKEHLKCLEWCRTLINNYGYLDEVKEALAMQKAIRSNPAWMEDNRQRLKEQLAEMSIALANTYLERGQPELAKSTLREVTRICPNSTFAEAAELRLNQLNGQPTLRVEFKQSK